MYFLVFSHKYSTQQSSFDSNTSKILDNLKQFDIRIKSDWLKRNIKKEQMHIKTKGFFSHKNVLSRATISKEAMCYGVYPVCMSSILPYQFRKSYFHIFLLSPSRAVGSDAGCQSSGCEFESKLGQHFFHRLTKVNVTRVIHLSPMG